MPIQDGTYKIALRSGYFLTKDLTVIDKQLSEMPLDEIMANVKGFGSGKRIMIYAKETGREAELLSLPDLKFPIGMDPDETRKDIYLAKLKEQFEASTFNDEMNLLRLSELYVQRYNLSKTVMTTLDSDGTRASQQLDNMILALEKHLQIDPQTRAAQAAAADPAAIIGEWVDQSALYLADEGSIHDTGHGPAGYTVWHFKSPEYMPRCASCGGQHFVFRSAWDEQDYPFQVAREDQIKRYVKGRDFKPEGAPALSIFEDKPL